MNSVQKMLFGLPILDHVTQNFVIQCYVQVNVQTWDLPNIRHQWYPHNCALQFQQEEQSLLSLQLNHETIYLSQKWFSLHAACRNYVQRTYYLLIKWLENASAAQEVCGG